MRSLLSCLILLVFFLFPGTAGAEGLTVIVAAETILPGPHITLGDVAAISGDNHARIEALRHLKIGNAPFAGRSIVLPMNIFGTRLLNKGVDLSGIEWKVPPYVKITAAHQILKSTEISAVAKDCILAQFAGKTSEDLIINQIGRQSDLVLPPGELTLNARLVQSSHTGLTACVDVDVLINGKLQNTIKMRFQVKLFEEVAVTTKPIAAGKVLTAENLKMERRDTSQGNSNIEYITDLNKVMGLTVRRTIGAGLALNAAALVKPRIMKRSNQVNIIAQSGGIEIVTTGIALQDGYEGQIIRVQNQNTRKIISAKIIDAETVKVLLHGGK